MFRHRFRIGEKMQTLPYYLIEFSFNNAHEEKFKVVMRLPRKYSAKVVRTS